MTALTDWMNFYIIIGGSAGALIGLQFVVVTLMADMPAMQGEEQATKAFTTPSVVHFQVVLLLSAIFCAPWHSYMVVTVLWGLIGLFGIVYSWVVFRRLRSVIAYDAVFEDWFFYVLLPLVSYLSLILSACVAHFHEIPALFGVGASAVLLLFTGIHNAWDLVTHIVFVRRRKQREEDEANRPKEP